MIYANCNSQLIQYDTQLEIYKSLSDKSTDVNTKKQQKLSIKSRIIREMATNRSSASDPMRRYVKLYNF